MDYNVSLFKGNHKNVIESEVLVNKTFKELGKRFSRCYSGGKYEAYWVRGVCDGRRCDANIHNSRVLIIDGDEGDGEELCSPLVLHEVLKDLGYNHFIYTTWSHKRIEIKNEHDGKNKFRCVIESELLTKEDLIANIGLILSELKECGISIKFVKEMKSWSQPWFVPTREDVKDGKFEFYAWYEGRKWNIEHADVDKVVEIREKFETESKVTDDRFMHIMGSGNGIHHAILNKSQQFMYEGCSKEFTLRSINMFIRSSVLSRVRPERFAELIDVDGGSTEELKRIVYGAWESCDVQVDLIEEKSAGRHVVPRPPGLLGKFYDEVKEMLRYPDDKIAMVTVLFICASICGRKFNVDHNDPTGNCDPTALNLYLTLCGGTGSGKDEPKRVAEKIFFEYGGIKDISTFLLSTDFTSVKAMFNILQNHRSIGVITGEAGIAMQSSAGDKAGVKGYSLSLYGRGHWNAYSDAKSYSDKDGGVNQLRAVALTRLSESTESELFKGYMDNNAIESGMVPRESVFRIDNMEMKTNRNRRVKFSEEVGSKFRHLIEMCSAVQLESDPKAHILYAKCDDMNNMLFDIQDKFRSIMFNEEENRIRQVMSSRMFVKILRYAGLATVFNKDKENKESLVLGNDEIMWGMDLANYEMETIEDTFADFIDMNSDLEIGAKRVAEVISRILNRDWRNDDYKKTPTKWLNLGIIYVSTIKRIVKKDKIIRKLTGSIKNYKGTDGLMLVLQYMKATGVIDVIDKSISGRKVKCIRVSGDFNDNFN